MSVPVIHRELLVGIETKPSFAKKTGFPLGGSRHRSNKCIALQENTLPCVQANAIHSNALPACMRQTRPESWHIAGEPAATVWWGVFKRLNNTAFHWLATLANTLVG